MRSDKFDLNVFLKETLVIDRILPGYRYVRIRPRILCRDGFCVSVQASEMMYCLPREDHGPYTHVELGYPNRYEVLLEDYIEDPDTCMLNNLFPYTPVELVERIIEKHGGFQQVVLRDDALDDGTPDTDEAGTSGQHDE